MDKDFAQKAQEGNNQLVTDKAQGEDISKEGISSQAQSYATKLARRIIIEAIEKRASDIFVEPQEANLRIRYRIDGLLREAGNYPVESSSSLVSYLKVFAGLDIAEHRFPQDGRFRIKTENKLVDFRVSVVASNLGEKIVLRVLDKTGLSLELDSLGLDEESIKSLKKNLKKPYGMLLVCGPTGSGKTTTLYSCIKFIDSVEKNIVTVEDPIEFQLPGINQVAVQEQIGLTFAGVLRSILRQDPNIIMIGEIRDFETADIAVKASLTGHLVLSTLHTTSAAGAVVRFVDMGIEPFLVASSCLLTASQALLRVLCIYCKRETNIPEAVREELKSAQLSIPANFKYYQPVGCKFCNNTGYSGRMGIIEILEIDAQIREILIQKATEIQIKEAAVKKGMRTLREKALKKVLEGLTTLEEVYRVTIK